MLVQAIIYILDLKRFKVKTENIVYLFRSFLWIKFCGENILATCIVCNASVFYYLFLKDTDIGSNITLDNIFSVSLQIPNYSFPHKHNSK